MTEKETNKEENNNDFEFLESYPFKTKAINERFYKELNEIKLKHTELFDSFPDNITDVESFLIIKEESDGKIIFSLNHKDLLTDDLELNILNFVNSFVLPSNE